MARRRRLSSRLDQAARTTSDLETLACGYPGRIMRRAKNKFMGRLLRPLWRLLWK